MHILGYDWPRLHAALNDLPAALLFVTVLFDLGAWITKRQSLAAAALWTLWAGVVGGWAAVVAGLQAEEVIDHGPAIHEIMEVHERQALVTMSMFTVVLVYKLFRRGQLKAVEEVALRVLSVLGFAGIIYTGSMGGKLALEHAAGVPTTTMQAEIEDRAKGHHHHPSTADSTDHQDHDEDSAGHHHDDGDHDH